MLRKFILENQILRKLEPFLSPLYHIHYFYLERKEGNILVHYLLGLHKF